MQRRNHVNEDKLVGLGRKMILDGIGFAWTADRSTHTFKPDDKLCWHQQRAKLIE
jgi:hypothetical protein